jgi:hypothetical protein
MVEKFTAQQQSLISSISSMELSDKAQAIAEMVHAIQVDKAGEPYIGHPRRVAVNATRAMHALQRKYSVEEVEVVRQASWLHDVVEDSGQNGFPDVTLEDLGVWGISKEVLVLVALVTKTEPKAEIVAEDNYYQAIKKSKLGRALKIADLTDNCNLQRVEALDDKEKFAYYRQAVRFLELDEDEKELFKKATNIAPEVSDEDWMMALLKEDMEEPTWDPDLGLESLYYRFKNAGFSDREASRRADQELQLESEFGYLRGLGYSNENAWRKARSNIFGD